MAPLRCAAKFDPFLSLDCAGLEGNPRKERDQLSPSSNLALHGYGWSGMKFVKSSRPVVESDKWMTQKNGCPGRSDLPGIVWKASKTKTFVRSTDRWLVVHRGTIRFVCSCMKFLPDPAWLLLSITCIPFRVLLHLSILFNKP